MLILYLLWVHGGALLATTSDSTCGTVQNSIHRGSDIYKGKIKGYECTGLILGVGANHTRTTCLVKFYVNSTDSVSPLWTRLTSGLRPKAHVQV